MGGLIATATERSTLDQIAVGRNRPWRSTHRVNLVYTIEVERFQSNAIRSSGRDLYGVDLEKPPMRWVSMMGKSVNS